mmetsp:Transcript_15687/g.23043  ORF Transcript_15687/g.23043 Transcript_15687/m.23043 type:complete len:667 (-) Transcript_15687:103-2103(-)
MRFYLPLLLALTPQWESVYASSTTTSSATLPSPSYLDSDYEWVDEEVPLVSFKEATIGLTVGGVVYGGVTLLRNHLKGKKSTAQPEEPADKVARKAFPAPPPAPEQEEDLEAPVDAQADPEPEPVATETKPVDDDEEVKLADESPADVPSTTSPDVAPETAAVEEEEEAEEAEPSAPAPTSSAGVGPTDINKGGATPENPDEEPEDLDLDLEDVPPLDVKGPDTLDGPPPQGPFNALFGDFLLKNDGDMGECKMVHTGLALENKVVAILFHANAFDKMLKEKRGDAILIPKLIEVYEQTKAAGKEFEIVYCGLDTEDVEFVKFFSTMPWLAMVQGDETKAIKQKLLAHDDIEIEGFPGLVIADTDGTIMTSKGLVPMITDPEGYPWKPVPLSELLGDNFLDGNGNVVGREAIEGKVLGLYFSADWCPPCKQFTPLLTNTYQTLRAVGKDFEIIYMSSDKSPEEFASYREQQPWLAIPYDDEKRRQKIGMELGVTGLPTLVIVGEDGEVITKNGRERVSNDEMGAEFPWHPVPLKDLTATTEGLAQGLAIIAFMEGQGSAITDPIIADMEPVAEKFMDAKVNEVSFFYCCEESQITQMLRMMVGLGDPQESGPVLVFMDLQKKVSHVFEGMEITEENLSQAIGDIVTGKIKMQEFDLERLRGDVDDQ